MRVSGVCRSWVIAASIWVRWKIYWRMRACMALKAALAWRISLAPVSFSGGWLMSLPRSMAAWASCLSGRVVMRATR